MTLDTYVVERHHTTRVDEGRGVRINYVTLPRPSIQRVPLNLPRIVPGRAAFHSDAVVTGRLSLNPPLHYFERHGGRALDARTPRDVNLFKEHRVFSREDYEPTHRRHKGKRLSASDRKRMMSR